MKTFSTLHHQHYMTCGQTSFVHRLIVDGLMDWWIDMVLELCISICDCISISNTLLNGCGILYRMLHDMSFPTKVSEFKSNHYLLSYDHLKIWLWFVKLWWCWKHVLLYFQHLFNVSSRLKMSSSWQHMWKWDIWYRLEKKQLCGNMWKWRP